MSFKSLLTSAFFILAAAGSANAACTLPTPPGDIPNGKKATEEEMTAAHQAIQDYNAKTTEYTDCLRSEYDATVAEKGAQMDDKQKKALEAELTKKHNAAIDKLQETAEKFNQQVRAFKAKSR